MICSPSFNNEMTKSICSGGWAVGFGAEAPHPLRIKPALHSLRTLRVWTNHTKNIVGDETAPYRKKVPALGSWSGARLFGAFLGTNEQEAEDGQPQSGRGCPGGTRRLRASPIVGTRWGWRQLCGAHRTTWTGGVAWAPVPIRSWAEFRRSCRFGTRSPLTSADSLARRVCGAWGTGRAGVLGRTAGVGGLSQGTAGGGHAFGPGRRGLGRGCHGSRLPGGSPKPACSWEGAGELRRVLQADWTKSMQEGGRPARCPSAPQHAGLPRERVPCFGEKKILFLLGLKVGLQMHSGIGGRGERRDYHLRLGALVSVSLGVTFYTPQRPTWNWVARPSHEVM